MSKDFSEALEKIKKYLIQILTLMNFQKKNFQQ